MKAQLPVASMAPPLRACPEVQPRARAAAKPPVGFGTIAHQGIKTFHHFEKEAGNTSITIEVLEKIKEIDPDTEVIIITGHGDIDNAIESLKYGASDFINKPVHEDEFMRVVRDHKKLMVHTTPLLQSV